MATLQLYSIFFKNCNFPPLPSDFIHPIQAGASLSDPIASCIQDNTGDHISSKNALYGELTAHYWVWKNAPKTDYVGFCHYRRFFDLHPQFKHPKLLGEYVKTRFKDVSKVWDTRFSNKDVFLSLLHTYDVMLPIEMRFNKSIKLQYHECHGDSLWFVSLFNKKFPHLQHAFNRYFEFKTTMHPTLMFVTSYEIFNRFMTWLFDFLFFLEEECEKQNRPWKPRDLAFIAERLMGFYFHDVEKGITIYNAESVITTQQSRLSIYLEKRKMLSQPYYFSG
jgi:hypothetical protein